ncbi:MAG TPA: class I SAM-dependent methyltransferase [Polyangiales bacterium]|nr:class I SAM-dependent methyltransferase [Polyangiales bacterium]
MTASLVAALRALASSTHATLVDPEDDVAAALLPAPLRVLLGAALAARPGRTLLAPALARASLGLADHITLRSAFIDLQLRAALAAGCTQLVIVGAGLDSRAHRLPELRAARVFEVDRAAGQRVKRARVRGLPLLARVVRYVSADLARASLAARLADAGHDARAPSALIVEGVLPYLPPAVRARLLEELARCAAQGSLLIASYVPSDLAWLRVAAPLVYSALWAIGEPMLGVLSPAELASELSANGFALLSDTDTRAWARQLCPDARREPFAVFERLVVAQRT